MLEYITMGMVLNKELTGYDIKKEIEDGIGSFYKASYGNLYPTLKRLTDKGYLTMNEQKQGNRLKKYYKATEAGKESFLEWLSAPIDTNASAESQLAQIFLYGELPKEIRDKRLQECEFFAEQGLRQLENLAKQLPNENMSDRDYFAISTLYYSLQNAYLTLHWLKFIKGQRPFTQFLQRDNG